MSVTPTKKSVHVEQSKTPKKSGAKLKRTYTTSLKAQKINANNADEYNSGEDSEVRTEKPFRTALRKSTRKANRIKKHDSGSRKSERKRREQVTATLDHTSDNGGSQLDSDLEELPATTKQDVQDLQLLQVDLVAGKSLFGFNTPKKRAGMAQVAMNTPKMLQTPKTPKTSKMLKTPSRLQTKTPDKKRRQATVEPKTPSHIRQCVKTQIAKLVETSSNSDFSAEESDFEPNGSELSSSDSDATSDDAVDDEPKTPHKGRRPIIVPVLPKTPSAARLRQSARVKKSTEYVPESDGYFQAHSSAKILTSDHTLDRLKNPRLPADRLFSLLAEMKLCEEHECSINSIMEEYRSYFSKWLYILNEGFNLLLYGLGSKRQLLQSFHRDTLAQQTVLVVNGFFPSLTLKDILDSITIDILDAGPSAGNPHVAVDMIEEEFMLIPETNLYLIVHNLDGTMLRNAKAQSILARLAKVPNIHLLASIDHINTPLLWDHSKLNNFNFSWWDCTIMLPYSDETAFENSLLVQNSGELALSSMRSVFLSLTTNARGIYMLIVKYQLKNKTNPNYQGMLFKDLYWSCREAFLVSSDLALRAQLTEFLDHKLVKSKRNIDGSEQLKIPIDAMLLQQFLDEQEKK